MTKTGFLKGLRYAVFCLLHFLIYPVQFAATEKERDEFMDRYHQNDLMCG